MYFQWFPSLIYGCIVLISLTCGRDIIPFGYGWRFHYGPEPGSNVGPGAAQCSFEEDLTDMVCTGMEHNPNRFSVKDCRLGCCYNPNCLSYQANLTQRHCFHGYKGHIVNCTKGKSGYSGGRRTKSPNPPFRTDYAFAADIESKIDADWPVVDVPHDFIAEYGNFTNNPEDFKHGGLPRNVSWYRKHFNLDHDWKDSTLWVHFEGVFHVAEVYFNGKFLQSHNCGYTGFTVRLDNSSSVRYGTPNVLAVRADASFGSGHWYEGGGIYRPVHLVRLDPMHFVSDGVFISPKPVGKLIRASAEVERHGLPSKISSADEPFTYVKFTLFDTDDKTVLATNSTPLPNINPDEPTIVTCTLEPNKAIQKWSLQTPTEYRIEASIFHYANDTSMDTLMLDVGFRTSKWNPDTGFSLNGQTIKFRGFSHHNSFAGVGVVIPDRLNLFKVQATRGLGGNMWRMSHNPYNPALYRFLDILGVLCWDENRDYGIEYVNAMHDMVKRDRNHASIVTWSFCNEYECIQEDATGTGSAFRRAVLGVDNTRPLTANGRADPGSLDVQGFSHSGNHTFINFHKQTPSIPTVLSECCSCKSQRDVRDLSSCMADQNSPSLLPYVTGSLGVWTLFDYFGEPSKAWPHVSSDFGQFDLAGFPKPHAYWYRSNWLMHHDAGRPPLPDTVKVRLVDLPDRVTQSLTGITTASFAELLLDGKSLGRQSVGISEDSVEPLKWKIPKNDCIGTVSFPINVSGLQCHGLTKVSSSTKEQCAKECCKDDHCNTWQLDQGTRNLGCWIGSVPKDSCTPSKHPEDHWLGGQRSGTGLFSNATLLGLDSMNSNAKVLARHTILMPKGGAVKIKLFLDVPSVGTGTGNKLLLDGADVALIRAQVSDTNSVLVSSSSARISFRVVSGPGRVIGIGNGDPTSLEWMKSTSVNAFGGLARLIVGVTQDCVSPNLATVQKTDVDASKFVKIYPDPSKCIVTPILVEAVADTLTKATISIPVSIDPEDAPMTVAKKTTPMFRNGFSYIDSFSG